MTQTYADILGAHDIAIPAHLAAQAEIPVLSGIQPQGDVIVIPTQPVAGSPVPREGVAVVRGENGGNTHLLVGEGLTWAPSARAGQDLGVVTVSEGCVGYLLHPEHGANAMAPGSYLLRRQREQADELRLVQD